MSFGVRAARPDEDVNRVLAAGATIEFGNPRAGAVYRAVRLNVVDLVEEGPQFPRADVTLERLL
ncbi:hypothetical protein GCM10011376_25950 [Nocardioides flavus (ex Wang et al. 2016)]|uniref:Uncharacterized protein n=1 Tax=Nocardioides flavus (ex Wang et al. 2016) TaxID=2058780 RepID=A0ABQ3HQ44_9ACTN|nr:hypothetical protein GCM10011376_25950 [Nocardioides flavus (ex Wang et al. 2016)]